MCQRLVEAASLQFLQQGTVAPLPRTVTCLDEPLPVAFVVDQPDLSQTRHCCHHMRLRIASGNQPLLQTPSGPQRVAQRAGGSFEDIGGIGSRSPRTLLLRVAATRHDAVLLRFGSDGGRYLECGRHRTKLGVDLCSDLGVRLEELLRLLASLA